MKDYPLTQAQYDVFTEFMENPALSEFNLSWKIDFPKDEDKEHLRRVIQNIIAARPNFRTRFFIDNKGNPRQYVDEDMEIPIPEYRMNDEQLKEYIDKQLSRPYDLLGDEPLCRFAIVETDDKCYFLNSILHIIGDGMTICTPYLKRDFPAAYAGLPLKKEAMSIFEYALEEEKLIGTDEYNEATKRYAEKFVGVKPTKFSPNIGKCVGKIIECDVSMEDHDIENWCMEHHIAPNVIVQAGFTLAVSRWSNEREVSYLSIRHGRIHRELLASYGMFANIMPVVYDVNPDANVMDFLKYIEAEWHTTLLMNNHSYTKFCRQIGCMPTIFFSYHGNLIMRSAKLNGKEMQVEQLISGLSDDDIQCMIFWKDNEHEIHLEGNDGLYDEAYIRRFAETIKTCVHGMMNHAECKLRDILSPLALS